MVGGAFRVGGAYVYGRWSLCFMVGGAYVLW